MVVKLFYSRDGDKLITPDDIEVKRITTDHKPSLPAEEARIKAAGGFVTRTQTKRGEISRVCAILVTCCCLVVLLYCLRRFVSTLVVVVLFCYVVCGDLFLLWLLSCCFVMLFAAICF